jgi:hypothetical protein
MASGPSLWPFNQEILEKELTLAAVQRTAAAYARYLAVNGRALGGFNPNDFVFCGAVRAIEGCRVRIRHRQRTVHPSRKIKAPRRAGLELYTTRAARRFGVVGAIIPWNAPVLLAALKIGPALCAGNTLVLKAAEDAPLGVLLLAEACQELLPPGVLNVLTVPS